MSVDACLRHHSILENVLLETMYDLPSIEGVSKVIVDEKTITEAKKPLLVYKKDEAAETTEELKAS